MKKGLNMKQEIRVVCHEYNCDNHGTGARNMFEVASKGTSNVGTKKVTVEIKGCGAEGLKKVYPVINITELTCDQFVSKERR